MIKPETQSLDYIRASVGLRLEPQGTYFLCLSLDEDATGLEMKTMAAEILRTPICAASRSEQLDGNARVDHETLSRI